MISRVSRKTRDRCIAHQPDSRDRIIAYRARVRHDPSTYNLIIRQRSQRKNRRLDPRSFRTSLRSISRATLHVSTLTLLVETRYILIGMAASRRACVRLRINRPAHADLQYRSRAFNHPLGYEIFQRHVPAATARVTKGRRETGAERKRERKQWCIDIYSLTNSITRFRDAVVRKNKCFPRIINSKGLGGRRLADAAADAVAVATASAVARCSPAKQCERASERTSSYLQSAGLRCFPMKRIKLQQQC